MATYADSIMANLAEVEEKLKELSEKKEQLRQELLQEQLSTGLHNFNGIYGKSVVSKKDTYVHSEKVQELEDRIKLMKIREIKNKKATVIRTTQFVRITWN